MIFISFRIIMNFITWVISAWMCFVAKGGENIYVLVLMSDYTLWLLFYNYGRMQ